LVQRDRDRALSRTNVLAEQEIDMNFLERLLGVAPDGGSGSLEMLLFLVPLAGMLLLRVWQSRRRRS
jgi:hypothetical protein